MLELSSAQLEAIASTRRGEFLGRLGEVLGGSDAAALSRRIGAAEHLGLRTEAGAATYAATAEVLGPRFHDRVPEAVRLLRLDPSTPEAKAAGLEGLATQVAAALDRASAPGALPRDPAARQDLVRALSGPAAAGPAAPTLPAFAAVPPPGPGSAAEGARLARAALEAAAPDPADPSPGRLRAVLEKARQEAGEGLADDIVALGRDLRDQARDLVAEAKALPAAAEEAAEAARATLRKAGGRVADAVEAEAKEAWDEIGDTAVAGAKEVRDALGEAGEDLLAGHAMDLGAIRCAAEDAVGDVLAKVDEVVSGLAGRLFGAAEAEVEAVADDLLAQAEKLRGRLDRLVGAGGSLVQQVGRLFRNIALSFDATDFSALFTPCAERAGTPAKPAPGAGGAGGAPGPSSRGGPMGSGPPAIPTAGAGLPPVPVPVLKPAPPPRPGTTAPRLPTLPPVPRGPVLPQAPRQAPGKPGTPPPVAKAPPGRPGAGTPGGGARGPGGTTGPSGPPARPPEQTQNWTQLRYLYADGTGVAGAQYTVERLDGTVLATGTLDGSGAARVALPQDVNSFAYFFDKDPIGAPYREQLKAHGLPVQPDGFLEGARRRISEGVDWVWGVVQGDFNQNPTVGQIIANTVLTMIPVVDQAADVRDVTANILALAEKPNDGEAWFGLVLSAIGLVPVAGSLAKGILKLLKRAADSLPPNALLQELIRIHNYFRKGNAVAWLREFSAELPQLAAEAAQRLREILAAVRDKIATVRGWTPEGLRAPLDRMSASLRDISTRASGEFRKVTDGLKARLDNAIASVRPRKMNGAAKQENTLRQTGQAPPADPGSAGRGAGKVLESRAKPRSLHADDSGTSAMTAAIRRDMDAAQAAAARLGTLRHPAGGMDLKPDLVQTFLRGEVRPDVLPPGTKVYRVVGQGSENGGVFWSLEPPRSEAAWRAGSAVPNRWNGDGEYIEVMLPHDVPVWRGKAGPQLSNQGERLRKAGQSPTGSDAVLAGGDEQIVMDPSTFMSAPQISGLTRHPTPGS